MAVSLAVAPGSYERIGDFLKLLKQRGVKARVDYSPGDQHPLHIIIDNPNDLAFVLDLASKNNVHLSREQ